MTQSFEFVDAVRAQKKLRLALDGPSGSGKTATALRIARALFPEGTIALIDSEGGSAAAYACNPGEEEDPDRLRFRFKHLKLTSYSPDTYVRAIQAAERIPADVIVIDSLSHAWAGKEGALEQVDRARATSRGGNAWAGWADVTPMQNRLVDAILQSTTHIIATMRTRTEWTTEKDERGKDRPVKIGMAPVQRDSIEYEFDVVATIDPEHELHVSKARAQSLDGFSERWPGPEIADRLGSWLNDGAPATPSPRELLQGVERAIQERGLGSDDHTPADRRVELAHAWRKVLGVPRVTADAILAWLRDHEDDPEALAAAIAAELAGPPPPAPEPEAPESRVEPNLTPDTQDAPNPPPESAEPAPARGRGRSVAAKGDEALGI